MKLLALLIAAIITRVPCCVTKVEQQRDPKYASGELRLHRNLSSILEPFRFDAILHAASFRKKLVAFEKRLFDAGMTYDFAEQRATSSNPDYQQLIRNGLVANDAVRYATFQAKPSFEDFIDFQLAGSLALSFRATILQGLCRAIPKCLDIPKIAGIEYRRPDGACNNRFAPNNGMASGGYFREILSQAYYDDFIDHERTMSVDRVTKLPSSRLVSVKLHGQHLSPDPKMNLLFMQYGQFIAHDFTEIVSFRPTQQVVQNLGYDCCSPTILADGTLRHPECFAMTVPADDPFYASHGVKCLNFIRAAPVPPWDCAIGTREQMNGQTSFIDLSAMYGSDTHRVNSLRLFEKGMLKTTRLNRHQYPPLTKERNECDIPQSSKLSCFMTGDDRGNMHIQLISMQVVFFRNHNRIANKLSAINPHWDDERLFQESRRILSAMHQHITYGSYLPLLVGPAFMKKHDLYPRSEGFYTGYSSLVDAGAGLAVSHSAFRLHNQIVGMLDKYQSTSSHPIPKPTGKIRFSDTFFDPRLLYNASNLDAVLNGMMFQAMSRSHNTMDHEVSQQLFRGRNKTYGSDLAAIDIQRGRDVGLSGHNSWIQYCGKTKYVSIDDMKRNEEFDPDFVERLKELYVNVDDIDVWSGGIAEKHVEGGNVGPTFACLIAFQFARLKRGDRFFYENHMTGTAFTGSQLKEIRKSGMARLMCDGGDNVSVVPRNPFMFPSDQNPTVSCSNTNEVPAIDFSAWTDVPQTQNALPVDGT